MNKTTSVVLGIIFVAIMMIMMPLVMSSTHDLQTDSQTDSYAAAVVGGGSTDVVLTEDLWNDDTSYVTAMTADGALAVPVADSYVNATNTLTITGLGADTPQAITVTYEYGALDDYTGMGEMAAVAPLLIFISLIAAVVGGIFYSFKH